MNAPVSCLHLQQTLHSSKAPFESAGQNRHRRIFSVLSGSAFDGDIGFGADAGGSASPFIFSEI